MTPKHNQVALPLNIDPDVLLMIQNLPRIPLCESNDLNVKK